MRSSLPERPAPLPQARILSVALRDFRNFERLELQIPREGFVLVGENGQGKTNLLEALYYLALLRSARGARDVDVTRFDAPGFHIDAFVETPNARQLSVGFDRSTRQKRVRRDGVIVQRLSDALGTLPVVMFTPGDVELVAGAPSARRRYLDIMLALSSRSYLTALQHYRGALARRNSALREAARHGGRMTAVEAWEPALAAHGAALIRERRKWAAAAAADFVKYCVAGGERGEPTMRYSGGLAGEDDIEERIARELVVRRTADMRQAVTSVGPHRDDLTLQLDGRDLRTFGSAGQQRTTAIALRVLEAETLRNAGGAAPVFLLDDAFAELDVVRSARVLTVLADVGLSGGQVVFAVPRASDIPPELTTLPRARLVAGVVSWER